MRYRPRRAMTQAGGSERRGCGGQERGSQERGSQGLAIAVSAGLFVLAVAVRALPWRTVLTQDGVIPSSWDAFYHLRRIAWGVAHFPSVLDFDRYLSFPDGAKPIWSPAFDWLAAAILRPFVASGDLAALEAATVWAPPLLGGATVAVLAWVCWRHFGPSVGAAAGGVLALLPAHYWYSQLGFLDHHAAVALVSTLALAAALEMVREPEPGVGTALAWGIGLAACLLVWPGSLLHVALLEVAVFAHVLWGPRGPDSARRAGRFALAQVVALAAVWPLSIGNEWPQWGAFSPLVLSRFQPWLFAVLALLGAGCWALWARSGVGATPVRRLWSATGVVALLLGASVLAWPELLAGAEDAFRWLARRESFQAQVAESRPLLAGDDGLRIGIRRLSLFLFAAPLAMAVAWRRQAGRPDAARVRLLVWWCAGLLAATLAQKRFFNTYAVGQAWLFAWVLVVLHRELVNRLGPSRRLGAAVLVASLAVLLLAPSLASYRPALANLRRADDDEPRFEVGASGLRRRAAVGMARWIRAHTPETAGWLDPSRVPEYGVLAPWEVGHVLQWVARRPTLIDNFGDDLGPENFELAQRLYAGTEAEAVPILEDLQLRYVVVTADPAAAGGRAGPRSLLRSLYHRDGAGLSRHRLVYESLPGEAKEGAPPLYKVFEVVPGASLEGFAPPGSRIDLRLTFTTQRKRVGVYRSSAVSDASGRYTFRVPYATRRSPSAVRTGRRVHLVCNGRAARVAIPEEAVLTGGRIDGPDLCLPK